MSRAELIHGFDHVVLTVRDVRATSAWYERILGFRRVTSDGSRVALHFGTYKINLHPVEAPYQPHAGVAQPGSADLCFLTSWSIEEVLETLAYMDVPVEHGPMPQTGAEGPMQSIYIRDPDGNLIEIARYE